jgi:hypothetical protein
VTDKAEDLPRGANGSVRSPDTDFFTDEQNLAELVTHMPEEDQQRFNNYGHFRVEAVFIDRLFIVYKPTGLTVGGQHRDPEILNLIKVIDFGIEPRNGCYAVLKDQNTQQELTITHVPRKLYAYPIYISLPPKLTIRWDARLVKGQIWRSLSFAFLIKTKNKSRFYSEGNTYAETPNTFRKLYSAVSASDFKF